MKITILVYHRGKVLAVGLTHIQWEDTGLTLAAHSSFSVALLTVISQNTQARKAHLTVMAYVANYG